VYWHILASDKGVSLFNTLVWAQTRDYRHKLYVIESKVFELHFFVADSMGLDLDSLTGRLQTLSFSAKNAEERLQWAITPFKVIQGQQFRYLWKAHM